MHVDRLVWPGPAILCTCFSVRECARVCVCVQVRRGRRRKCVKTVPPVPAKGRVVTLETVVAISISISIDAAFCGYQKLLVRFFFMRLLRGCVAFSF